MTKVLNLDGLTYYTGKIKGITNELQEQINDLKNRGRFLSVWIESQGKPQTNPAGYEIGDTYTYSAGDYYLISSLASEGGTNYRPDGTSYVVGSSSTVVETEDVSETDVYYFDGAHWILWINTQKEVAFTNIAGSPYDNTNLANALNSKQNTISDLATIRSGAALGTTSIQPNDNISSLTNDSNYISANTYPAATFVFTLADGTTKNYEWNVKETN